jgi:5-methylthioadenosine/S-adenosylhomocysteine deaminase
MTRPVVTGIGPTSLQAAAVCLGISVDLYAERICSVARTLTRWRVTLAVNGDSESTAVLARAFLEAGENPVCWYVQEATDSRAARVRSTTVVVPPKDIPASLLRAADVVLCVGFGTGTALEVCLAKFESRARVLVLKELVSSRLPKECAFDRLEYVGIDGLATVLSSVLGPGQEKAYAHPHVVGRPATTTDSHFVIRGGNVIPGAGDWTPSRHDLEVESGRITAIGPNLDATAVYDARGKFVIPGLVNAHLHLGAQFFRFDADRSSLSSFVGYTDQFFESSSDPGRLMKLSTWATLGESLAAGTTTVAVSKGWRELDSAGLGGVCFYPVMRSRTLGPFLDDLEDGVRAMADFCRERRLGFGVFLPSLLHVDRPLLRRVAELVAADDMMHVALHYLETSAERTDVRARFGQEPIDLLLAHGLLGGRTILAHCAHLLAHDVDAIRAAGAHVVVCPLSSALLRTGLPPLGHLRAEGLLVSLGTDGPATGTTLSLLDHAKFIRHLYPEVELTAEELATLITSSPARALGLEQDVGSLHVGKLANAILFDEESFYGSSDRVLEELMWGSAKMPVAVIAEGEVLIERGDFTDGVLRQRLRQAREVRPAVMTSRAAVV